MGYLTGVQGDPWAGKSFLTLKIAASVSRGETLPGNQKLISPSIVLLLAFEDGPADIIRPRLDLMGADNSRIIIPDPCQNLSPSQMNVEFVEAAVKEIGPALVIIDPIVAFGGKRNNNKDSDVRELLQPLNALAQKYGFAGLLVRHLNKQSGSRALYRGSGSIDYAAAFRSIFTVAEDPSEQGRRVFAHTKSNLGALQRSLSFRISDNGVEWGGEIEITDNELIAERSFKIRESRQLDEAKAFLEKVLEPGPMKSDDVKAAAGGIAKNTLWRAHKALDTRGVTKHGKWKIQTYLSHERQCNYIVPKLGEIKASKLRKSQIEQAAGNWKEARSSEVANVLLSTLSAAFKWALRDPDTFGVRMNPLDTVERFAREERPEEIDGETIFDYGEAQLRAKPGTLREVQPHEVLSKLELRKIIEAAAPGMERTMLMVAIFCGLRHGEIAGLRWSVIDFKRRTLTVNRSLTQLSKKRGGPRLEAPKRKKSVREMELPAPLVAELRQWKLQCPPNPLDLVFVNSLGRPTCRQDKRDRLKAVCKRAGVKPVTMHSLRHSYASHQLIDGTSPLEVSKLMGHSSPGVTLSIYAHWIKGEKSHAQ